MAVPPFHRLPGTQYVASPPGEPLKVEIAASDITLNVDAISLGTIELQGASSGNIAEVTSSHALLVDGSATVQPVSISSIPLATNASTASAQTSAQTSLTSIDTSTQALGAKTDAKNAATDTTSVSVISVLKQISASIQAPPSQAVTGPLTDTQLRATAVPVSGTFFQGTQPVSIASLPVGHNIIDSGTLTAVTSITNPVAVTLAVAPTTPVTGTFWQATQPVSGTVTANAGTNLNTSALALEAGNLATIVTAEATGNTTLASILTNTPVLGQTLSSASTPVVASPDEITWEQRSLRRTVELELLTQFDASMRDRSSRQSERSTQTDRRGALGRGSSR